jgi:hypothetical protein
MAVFFNNIWIDTCSGIHCMCACVRNQNPSFWNSYGHTELVTATPSKVMAIPGGLLLPFYRLKARFAG